MGIKCSTGKIIAFTDDDAMVDANWLERILQNFADRTVAIVTGIALPIELNTKAQHWFEKTNSFKRGFDRKKFDTGNINPLAAGLVGAGVNMAIRRSCLTRIGNFDEALDGGTPTRSGGDQEFFYRSLSRGYRIVYDPDAIVWHRHRDSWKDLRSTIYGYGVGLFAWWTRALIIEREISLLRWGLLWFVKHHFGNLIRSLLKRKNRMPFDLAFAEFRGAIIGSFCYFHSRFKSNRLE
jgi:GT2 family glycosyltransferase